jgi:sugar phosphate permease
METSNARMTSGIAPKAREAQDIDGGVDPALARYRWVVLFVVWGAFLLSYIDRVAWSSVAAPVGQSLGIPVAMLGAFVTAFYVGYVIANLVGGVVSDAIGGRLTLTLALVPLGIATFCFSYAHSLSTGIGIQIIMGLAAGADYSAGMKIISAWFHKDRGRAMGLYTTATSIAVVTANMAIPAFSAAHGWQSAFKVLGGVTLLWAVVAVTLVKNSPYKTKSPSVTRKDLATLLRNRTLVLIAVAGFCAYWGVIGFTAYANVMMTRGLGISPVTAGSIVALFGVGAAIAKPGIGWFSDLIGGRRKLLSMITLGVFAAVLLLFGQLTSVDHLYLIAPILGVVAFGYMPLLMAELTVASGTALAGAAAGWTNAVWQFGSAVAPIVVGLVFSKTHSIPAALMTLALGPLLAVVALAFVRTPMKSKAGGPV